MVVKFAGLTMKMAPTTRVKIIGETMKTSSKDRLALFVISPQWLIKILSNGMCAKPTHGIKNMVPVSLGVDKNTGNLILCVSSGSVPEYIAFNKCMEQSVPSLVDTTVIDGVEISGLPVIQASFEEIHQDGQVKSEGDQKHGC